MKTFKTILLVITMFLLLTNTSTIAQEKEQKRPEYVVVTTMHWNMDYEDWDRDTWQAVEKEFMDKVTKKNEFIVGASIHLHLLTPDSSELLYVQVYKDWDAIDKATNRNEELEKEAWPDKELRKAFFKKRNAYYAPEHSDEIYATMEGAKYVDNLNKDMILFVRKSNFAFPEDGSFEEYTELKNEFLEKVLNKNEYIKGYYPNSHAYGTNRTDHVEAFYLNSLADLKKMFDRYGELAKEAWPDETIRKERRKKAQKYFTGIHGDYVYSVIPELTK